MLIKCQSHSAIIQDASLILLPLICPSSALFQKLKALTQFNQERRERMFNFLAFPPVNSYSEICFQDRDEKNSTESKSLFSFIQGSQVDKTPQ